MSAFRGLRLQQHQLASIIVDFSLLCLNIQFILTILFEMRLKHTRNAPGVFHACVYCGCATNLILQVVVQYQSCVVRWEDSLTFPLGMDPILYLQLYLVYLD